MERAELINHLEHLAEYVKYSEDAPALREAISLLKTHEERTETHVCDLIQPDHNAEVSKKVGDDLIRRHGVSAWLYNLGYPKLADIVMNEQRFKPAQPQCTCVNCGRTVNNGGWYADGRTRCPIEEHYALPKDGYCHLWEKRNVTDDDYPERREE